MSRLIRYVVILTKPGADYEVRLPAKTRAHAVSEAHRRAGNGWTTKSVTIVKQTHN